MKIWRTVFKSGKLISKLLLFFFKKNFLMETINSDFEQFNENYFRLGGKFNY